MGRGMGRGWLVPRATHGSPLRDIVPPAPPTPSRRALLHWASALLLSAAAASANVDLSARVEPTEVRIGDPVRYAITVTHPAGTRAELPAVRGNTGRLEVEGYAVAADTASDGRVTVTHTLVLTPWSPGDDTLPPQRVEVRHEGDTAAQVLYTQPTRITVRATAPQGATEIAANIADIHDSERLPRGFPWALPLLIAAVLLAVWALRRRARRPKPVTQVAAPALSPDTIALARLRELEAAALPAREFAFALSEIVRGYLAARFGIDALEATTVELLERTGALPLTNAQHDWLRVSCEALDRVKFADATLNAADAARQIAETADFVRETTTAREPTQTPNEAGPA